MTRSWDMVQPSERAKLIHPLLGFSAKLNKIAAANKEKLEADGKGKIISLAVGDPALDGNLPPPPEFMHHLREAVESTRCNGYTPSVGTLAMREAIAEYWIRWFAPNLVGKHVVSADRIVVTNGTADALSTVCGAIGNPGDSILIPKPYFSQYDFSVWFYGIEPAYYPLMAEQDWEVDLDALRHIVEADKEKKIKAIILNNPSNPCGSNWSRPHVEAIVKLCEELHLPIISDEIYIGMVYNVESPADEPVSTSVADIESTATRFVVTGVSKRFSVPGQRTGWVMQVDPTGAGDAVMQGVKVLSSRFLVPSTPMQVATTKCLKEVDESYFKHAKNALRENAAFLYKSLSEIPGLKPLMPSGGMFMSVLLETDKLEESLRTGTEFAYVLAAEENVHVFPGEAFKMPAALRLTLSRTMDVNTEAVKRIKGFCARHQAH